MPQFDFSTISVVLFSFITSFSFYYSLVVLNLLPEIISNLKFRVKKHKKKNFNLIYVFLPNVYNYSKIIQYKSIN